MSTKATKRPAGGSPRPAAGATRPAGGRVSAATKSALRGEAVYHAPLLAFGRTNWILMGAGVGAAVLGFVFLSMGDITIAPILLVAGYCALLPLGIVWSDRRSTPGGGRPGANSSAG